MLELSLSCPFEPCLASYFDFIYLSNENDLTIGGGATVIEIVTFNNVSRDAAYIRTQLLFSLFGFHVLLARSSRSLIPPRPLDKMEVRENLRMAHMPEGQILRWWIGGNGSVEWLCSIFFGFF